MSDPVPTKPSGPDSDAAEDATAEPAGKQPREPLLGLSMTQVVGGSAAAATAAALGSRLGLIGTVVGAALISVVTAVAGAVYSRSLQRTKEVVARAGERLPTVRIPVQRPHGQVDEATEAPTDVDTDAPQRWWHRVRWRPVAVTAVVVFLLAGGIVTGIEALTGRSLDGTGRTSVDHLVGRDSTPERPVQNPSDDASPSDQGSTGSDGGSGTDDGTDDDQGSGSPATERPTPTPSPTATPSDGETGGSGSATPTPQPSATPTPTPTAR